MVIPEELNDYELVYMAQEQNEDAKKILYAKYSPIISRKTNRLYRELLGKGIDKEDIIQECYVGFEKAIDNYNPDNQANFYTFVNLCMDRQLKSEAIKSERLKNKILNNALPIELINDDETSFSLLTLLEDNYANPELELFSMENVKELKKRIVSKLTNREKEILDLRINGCNYKEIADKLNITEKSVDNAMQRIKIKVKEFLN